MTIYISQMDQAVERGIHFEILYGPLLTGTVYPSQIIFRILCHLYLLTCTSRRLIQPSAKQSEGGACWDESSGTVPARAQYHSV